ncbi:uncharacterized protein BYT42DRAFT_533400 [Radiomyces spectabilis]|uniref:uncharacterized protein n=1 Tax=Radiomyces spectabilis TaxID=64574 RepID=UPI00221FA89D|nr:uncharacterized protein BYT42DRAFT_533400 [Radiomyces spectabilis]KAI8377751.1 hypothetical protein BYT42DRAFT_533400 [Radiomyces spectabilis]
MSDMRLLFPHTIMNTMTATHSSTTCSSMPDILRSRTVMDVSNLLSPAPPLKAKRKRASPSQLSVLNRVFNQTYFPSTELRMELGKQLGMSPRTVQIWFQNKRQSIRAHEKHHQYHHHHHQHQHSHQHPHTYPSQQHHQRSPSLQRSSPSSSPVKQSLMLSPPSSPYMRPTGISLPPLRLPPPASFPLTPSSSAYPSPDSMNSIFFRD